MWPITRRIFSQEKQAQEWEWWWNWQTRNINSYYKYIQEFKGNQKHNERWNRNYEKNWILNLKSTIYEIKNSQNSSTANWILPNKKKQWIWKHSDRAHPNWRQEKKKRLIKMNSVSVTVTYGIISSRLTCINEVPENGRVMAEENNRRING